MRFRIFSTFILAILLLAGSFSVLNALPNVSDFGFTMNASAAAPPFSGGNGSAGNPFLITNVSQLQNMSANESAHYILINDIDCAETSGWNAGKGFLPIAGDDDLGTGGFQGSKFTGSLDGHGYNITDLYINQVDNRWIGFFGWVEVGGKISNVSLKNISMWGEGQVGGLVGYNLGDITSCYVEGSVIGDAADSWNVGGLIGENNQGTISYCYTNCVVRSFEYGGGLVGVMSVGLINNSYSMGPVTGTGSTYFGGLVGDLGSTINNSYATGSVISPDDDVGGLVGSNRGNIYKSFATGSVQGSSYVGGLVADNYEVIRNCYATGSINGNSDVGGLVGYNSDRINNSYSNGSVSGNTNVGGFIGRRSGTDTVTGCYFDNITSGKTTGVGSGSSAGIIGKNSSDMKKQATFTPASWDFINIWGIVEDSTYPFLWQFYNTPQLITQNLETATEDTMYSHDLKAYYSNYPPVNYIEWTFKSNTDIWLTIDSKGKLSGTPSNNDVGTPWVNVTISDLLGESDTYNYTLTILNVNDPPTINNANVESATEDILYNVDYDAIDIDLTSDVLTWNLTTNAYWLALNSTTGNLTGIPENVDVGSYWLKIDVNDGNGGSDSTEFFLEVENVNDDPMITTTQIPMKVKEEKLYVMDFDAIDLDPTNDVLTWDIDKNANWLTFNTSTAVLFGTPINNDVGVYGINITVTDGNGGSDWFDYDLTVQNVNDLPMIITTDKTTAKVGELYSNQYNATDIDLPGDILTWSLETNTTTWLNINSTSGLVSGTPGLNDSGMYWVKVMVSDGNSGSDSHNFTLVVEPKTVIPPVENKDPEITTNDVVSAEVDTKYSVVYEATDDRTNVLDLTWSVNTNASWLAFNLTTKTLTGTPTEADVGSYRVEITVSDGEGGTDVHNFTITVPKPYIPGPEPKNNPPSISPVTEEQKSKAGEKFTLIITGSDQDEDDEITFTLDESPTGMVISKDGEILWIPDDDQVGTHTVTVSLSDGTNTTKLSFNVTIDEGTKIEPEEPETEKEKEFALEEGMPYLIILLIVGLILGLIIGMLMARKKKPADDIEADEELEDEELAEEEPEEEDIEDEELEDEELEEEELEDEDLDEEELEEEDLEDEELEDEEVEEEDLEE